MLRKNIPRTPVEALLAVLSLLLASAAGASESPDFFMSSPNRIVYSRTDQLRSSVGEIRQYVWDITVQKLDEAPSLDQHNVLNKGASWRDLVRRDLTMAFGGIAASILARRTDASAEGWPLPRETRRPIVLPSPESMILDSICRAHRKKPSLVLPAPYFEDVQYCVRFIFDPTEAYGSFRLQAEADVLLARNSESEYTVPKTEEETASFEKLLIEFVAEIRGELKRSAADWRWGVEDGPNNTFDISDCDRWAGLVAVDRENVPSTRLGSGDDLDFTRAGPNHIAYDRTWDGRCPSGSRCAAPIRFYVSDISIYIKDTRDPSRANSALEDRAERDVLMAFGDIARTVLASRTDTIAVGWQDLEDTVCRAHQKKPSLVLPAPYFEDVEYCFSLVHDNPSGTGPRTLRLRAETNISITKNPGSGYHEPNTQEEITSFTELLVNLATEIRIKLEKSATVDGWHVVDSAYNTFSIDGRYK